MSVNKFLSHVLVVPEDRANEQIANGFIQHDQVDGRQIQILPPANGWSSVREKFEIQYIPYLRNYLRGHVILLVDFDADYLRRRELFDEVIPHELRERVFVIGARQTPEILRQSLEMRSEDVGLALADDCYQQTTNVWCHDQLIHNEPDRFRLYQAVRPILFPG